MLLPTPAGDGLTVGLAALPAGRKLEGIEFGKIKPEVFGPSSVTNASVPVPPERFAPAANGGIEFGPQPGLVVVGQVGKPPTPPLASEAVSPVTYVFKAESSAMLVPISVP